MQQLYSSIQQIISSYKFPSFPPYLPHEIFHTPATSSQSFPWISQVSLQKLSHVNIPWNLPYATEIFAKFFTKSQVSYKLSLHKYPMKSSLRRWNHYKVSHEFLKFHRNLPHVNFLWICPYAAEIFAKFLKNSSSFHRNFLYANMPWNGIFANSRNYIETFLM